MSVDANRYSVPERFVGQSVTVYKYPTDIVIRRRGSEIATHPRLIGQRDARHTLAEHHPTPDHHVLRSFWPSVSQLTY